jgi:hypothetical protein
MQAVGSFEELVTIQQIIWHRIKEGRKFCIQLFDIILKNRQVSLFKIAVSNNRAQ